MSRWTQPALALLAVALSLPRPARAEAAAAAPAPTPVAAPSAEAPVVKTASAETLHLPSLGEGAAVVGAPASLPPVSAQLFRIGGQLEVQPMFLVSIGDPFWRTAALGVRAEKHLDDRWSFGAHLFGGASLVAAPVAVCGSTACSAPAAARLRSTPGNLQLLVGAELGWAPVYGKLSLIGESTLHFDAYLSLGPELVLERIAPDATAAEQSRWAPGIRAGLGERFFITDRLAVRLGASELVYAGRVRGRTEVERKLSIEGGLAWMFGAGR